MSSDSPFDEKEKDAYTRFGMYGKKAIPNVKRQLNYCGIQSA